MADEVHERKDVRKWGGPPLVRAVFTLIGVAAAGFLVWLATLFAIEQTGEFWAAMGLIAGAGLALGLSQLFGGWTKWGVPIISRGVFVLAFLPTAVVVGWILLAAQPEGGWQQGRLEGWSDDIGLAGLVQDLGTFAAVLAFGLGLILAFTFDTTGPRSRDIVERDVVPDEEVHDYERRDVRTAPADEHTVVREDERVETVPPRRERP